jgi:hypothetical protein
MQARLHVPRPSAAFRLLSRLCKVKNQFYIHYMEYVITNDLLVINDKICPPFDESSHIFLL